MSANWIADDIARERKSRLHHQLRRTRALELALFAAYWFLMGGIAGWIAARWAQ